jgi:hypothetical protein
MSAMKKFLILAAALLVSAAPARADESAPAAPAAAIDDHSGFGAALFTNVSPAGFEDPASSTAVATSIDPSALADIAPAAGDEEDSADVNAEIDAGRIIAPAAAGVAQ